MSTPAPSRKWKSRLLTAVGAAALAILVTLSGVTAPFDAWVYDRLVLGAAPEADPRIVVGLSRDPCGKACLSPREPAALPAWNSSSLRLWV